LIFASDATATCGHSFPIGEAFDDIYTLERGCQVLV